MKRIAGQTAEDALLEKIEIIKNIDFSTESALPPLISIMQEIRPRDANKYGYAKNQLKLLIKTLHENCDALNAFRSMLSRVIAHSSITELLTSSGIPKESGFFSELYAKLKRKILPPLQDRGSILYAIDSVFYRNNDYKWVNAIDDSIWAELFSILNLNLKNYDREQVSKSLHILSCKLLTISVERDFKKRLNSSGKKAFEDQNKIVLNLIQETDEDARISSIKRLQQQLDYCNLISDGIREQNIDKGTSIQQSLLINKAEIIIDRLRFITQIDKKKEDVISVIVESFKWLIKNENTKNSIGKYFISNIKGLAYRISEHEHDTGEHYITSDEKSYKQMFSSATFGGALVAVMALVKNLLSSLTLAPFWQSFYYSVNYALGFIGIHVTGATLATKQPAMTASTIAGVLDRKKSGNTSMTKLAILFSQVIRSQTASFVGNLIVVFPLGLAIAFLWHFIIGKDVMSIESSQALIDSLHITKSKSILYACYTGGFLYLSGIISGFFDNKVVFSEIPQRIKEHPFFKRSFTKKSTNKIADYIGDNLGLIMGNVCLGFMLGMAGFFSYTFGFDLDVRHITLSMGNFAFALKGLMFQVTTSEWVGALLGIIVIGFFNFLVSFSLAFATALISRNIRFSQYKVFVRNTWKLVRKYPMDFVWPPKQERKPEDFV